MIKASTEAGSAATQPPIMTHDQLLQQMCPTIMVPRFAALEPLKQPGHRFLAAADGLWLEVYRPWVHIVWPIARQEHVPMPYGSVVQKVEFAFDTIPASLFQMFIDDARIAMPNEFAAWFTWNAETKEFRYRPLVATSAGVAHLELVRPPLDENEHLVVDIHSHGSMRAFYSPEDNSDDAGEVKLSAVVGRLGEGQTIMSKLRLCAHGVLVAGHELVAQGLTIET